MNKFYNYHKPSYFERLRYNKEGKSFPLIYILVYGKQKIPIYLDDYGQQLYMRYQDKNYCAGPYCGLLSSLDYFLEIIQNKVAQYYWDDACENAGTRDLQE